MKKFLSFFGVLFLARHAWAQACTTLCPVILGASLTLAQYFGVKNEVVGVLAGALMSIVGYILIRIFDKRGWRFSGRDFLLMAIALGSIGFIYMGRLEYKPALHWKLLYIDSFLLAAICGAAAHILGVNLYAWMKAKNGGHAHFPFEKVLVPLVLDGIVLFLFWGTDLCECQEIMILN